MPRPEITKPIYFVVTIRPGGFESRTVGYFHSKVDAVQVICEDMGNINEEGYYRYAMVEELEEGLYPVPKPLDGSHETWFSWRAGHWEPQERKANENYDQGDIYHPAGYYPCDKPAKFNKVIGWAVG